MDIKLKIAAQFVQALTFVNVLEIQRTRPDLESLNFFIPSLQIPLPWITEEMQDFFPCDSVVTLTDRLLATYRFIGLQDSIVIVGPYRSSTLRRFEASAVLDACHLPSSLLERYMKYFNSLPYVSEETMQIVTHNILIALHGEARSISERKINMNTLRPNLPSEALSSAQARVESIENRHSLEEFFMSQISKGNFEVAFSAYHRLSRESTPVGASGNNTVEAFAIIRTLVRIAARNGGVPAAGIHAITEAYRARFNNAKKDEERKNLVNQFLSDVCTVVRRYHTLPYSPPICQTIEYISRNLKEPLSLETIAEETGLSPTWLSRKFHQETGQPIIHYITQERMHCAADYLSFTDMSVQEISESVGVNDANYFAKLFKRFYSLTPSEFRKKAHHPQSLAE